MQRDMCQLLRQYLTNFIRPECLTGVSEDDEMEVPNAELGIGTATRLLLEEEADSMEGMQQEAAFFTTIRAFYREAVSKMVKPFTLECSGGKTWGVHRQLSPGLLFTLLKCTRL